MEDESYTYLNEIKLDKLSVGKRGKFYSIDITDIPSAIENIYAFMSIHPEFFRTNVNKRLIYVNNSIYSVYNDPVHFNDPLHKVSGYISTEYNDGIYKMIINLKNNRSKQDYILQIDQYVRDIAKNGHTVTLYYHKILSDVIIKHCYYTAPHIQWIKDVETLKQEFFSYNKDYLLSIMENKINHGGVSSMVNSWNNMILIGKPGTGKCHGIDTEILMYDGTIKKVQDIKVGDQLMGDDSTPRNVLELCRGRENMYKVIQGNDIYTVNESHILSLYNISTKQYINISVSEYINLPLENQLKCLGYRRGFEKNTSGIENLYIKLLGNEIPYEFKTASINDRRLVLSALVNLQGCIIEKNQYVIDCTHLNKKDVLFLIRSIGANLHVENNKVLFRANLSTIRRLENVCEEETHEVIMIKPLDVQDYYGFTLDGNNQYLLGNFVVTHNSSYIHRISLMLKMPILSVDISQYLNRKKELYAMFYGQNFHLPNSVKNSPKESSIDNAIIVLEEFDHAMEKLLDIENIFKYKDIIKRNYLDGKNQHIKKRAMDASHNQVEVFNVNENETIDELIKVNKVDNYADYVKNLLKKDGIDIENNSVSKKAKDEIINFRDHENELNMINAELNKLLSSMDDDNRSNILRLSDMLELFQGPVPVKDRIIIATTNNFDKIKNSMPALFRSGRMSVVNFEYLDWISLNKLTMYYFKQEMNSNPFEITIPTSQIVELAVKYVLMNDFDGFKKELGNLCNKV